MISGDPNKVAQGTEIDTEFNNIATAVATKADKASPTFTGTVTTAAIASTIDDAGTNSVTDVITVTHTTSGTAAAGIGAGIAFAAETLGGTHTLGTIDFVTTDVTDTSEDADFVVNLMAAGATAAEAFRVTSTGAVVMTGGSITDSTGAIDFGDENLSTTGTLAAGATSLSGDLTMAVNQNIFMQHGSGVQYRIGGDSGSKIEIRDVTNGFDLWELANISTSRMQMRVGVSSLDTQPQITAIADSDTGMRFDGSDGLRLVTGGTAALVIDSSQNFDFQSGNLTTTGTVTGGQMSFDSSTGFHDLGSTGSTMVLRFDNTSITAGDIAIAASTTNLQFRTGGGTTQWAIDSSGDLDGGANAITTTGTLAAGDTTITGDTSTTRLAVGHTNFSANVPADFRYEATGTDCVVRVYNTDQSNTTTQTARISLAPDSRGGALVGMEAYKVTADYSSSSGRDAGLKLYTMNNGSEVLVADFDNAGATTLSGTLSTEGAVTVNRTSSDDYITISLEDSTASFQATNPTNSTYPTINIRQENNTTVRDAIKINGSGQVIIAIDGTANAPALCVGGDTDSQYDNGMYYAGADSIGFSTNNTAALVLNSTQGASIASDTIIGSTSVTPDGTLHVHTGSAGTVTAVSGADDLIVENSADGGITIFTPDANVGSLYFGSPNNTLGARISYHSDGNVFVVGSHEVGDSLSLRGDDNVTNLTLSGGSGSELATFAGDVTLSGGALSITNTVNESAFTLTSSATTNDAVNIICSGLTAGRALDVYSNSTSTSTREIASFRNDNTLATGATVVGIQQDAAQIALFLDQNGNGIALDIDSEATNQYCIRASAPTSNVVAYLNNQHVSTPLGVMLDFQNASPDDNTQYFLRCEDSTTARCYIYSDGDLANHDGTYGTISDARYKSDIVTARSYWEDWKDIRFATFTKGGKKQFGVIAQELMEIFPGLVHESPDENMEDGVSLWVDTMNLNHIGGRVLQEAMERIEELEAEVKALKGE